VHQAHIYLTGGRRKVGRVAARAIIAARVINFVISGDGADHDGVRETVDVVDHALYANFSVAFSVVPSCPNMALAKLDQARRYGG